MPFNGNAAALRSVGLILAGAVAGLTGGAYTGSEAGSAEVQRELGTHQARIEQLQVQMGELKEDVESVSTDVHDIGSQLNRIELLLEREHGGQ
tara:strand:+ start:534 stop:812 length:279 start_codon:yes stop_codon:yes gene_type:complete